MNKVGYVLKEGEESCPDFDRMIAYLLDENGERKGVIQEKII